jgi:hypothetical protein
MKKFLARWRACRDWRSYRGGALLGVPVRVSILAGLTRNYILSWSAPRGTATTEFNLAYQSTATLALTPVAEALPASSARDWPSYNRTLTSERYAELSEINSNNVGSKFCAPTTLASSRPCLRSDRGGWRPDRHH